MARSYRNTAEYIQHPNDKSRKGAQRQVNKTFRQQTRTGLRKGTEALPVVRRRVDRIMH